MWFFRSPEIVFGPDALDHLANIRGRRALIITDKNIVGLGLPEHVLARLAEAGIETSVFAEVEPEPSLQTVQRAAEAALAYQPDWIVGLGGGSCMDAAKVAWFLYERPDVDLAEITPFEYFGLRAKARLIAIPTTSGTGSEATMAAVLTDTDECRKVAVGSPEMIPDVAIVDPALTMNLPCSVTADTGLDVLTHAVEGYSSTWHNDFSDGLCLTAVRLVFEYLPRACDEGADDPEAREKMHNAATLAGLGFGNSMAALAHALGHALGAEFHIPHGRAVGLFLPYTLEFNANEGKGRYVDIARTLGLPAQDEAEAARHLVAAIRELQEHVDQPTALHQAGITSETLGKALPRLVANAETDTQIVMSARMPKGDETERLFLYALEGKTIDF